MLAIPMLSGAPQGAMEMPEAGLQMKERRTSSAKVEANRKNAQKSTGPKDTSLTRLNALRHGLLSKEVLIEGEDEGELEELGKRLRMELTPQSELENIFVDRIVSSTWRLKRAARVERDFIQGVYKDCEVFGGVGAVARCLGYDNTWLNLIRYETAIEKQIYKALHELLRLQSTRKGERPPLPIAVDVDVSTDSDLASFGNREHSPPHRSLPPRR